MLAAALVLSLLATALLAASKNWLGAGLGDEFDENKLRYHKVIIMADADVDGAHIRTLLLTFFFRFMRPLIEQGYVYSAVPPLFKLSRGKQQKVAYSEEERDQISAEMRGGNPNVKIDINRFKGLGEMNPHELWETTLPQEIVGMINDVGFLESIPLWAVTLLGGLFITVLAFIMILTVYGRLFKLYMYTAIAPIPLSTFAGEPSGNIGKNFLRSYAGVCLEGAVIALACIIFSVMAASPPAVDTSVSAVTAVWSYVGELIFNLLVLVGAVRMSDRIVKELMGL